MPCRVKHSARRCFKHTQHMCHTDTPVPAVCRLPIACEKKVLKPAMPSAGEKGPRARKDRLLKDSQPRCPYQVLVVTFEGPYCHVCLKQSTPRQHKSKIDRQDPINLAPGHLRLTCPVGRFDRAVNQSRRFFGPTLLSLLVAHTPYPWPSSLSPPAPTSQRRPQAIVCPQPCGNREPGSRGRGRLGGARFTDTRRVPTEHDRQASCAQVRRWGCIESVRL